MSHWIYCLYNDGSIALSMKETNQKFIQSSTIMCLEKTFGILKGRWRLRMKRFKVPWTNMPDIIATCIILHNLSIVNNEEEWVL